MSMPNVVGRTAGRLGIGTAGGALLLLVHREVVTRGPTYAGPLLVLDHLFSLVAVGVLVWSFLAAGLGLLAALRLQFESPLERLLFGVALGAGALGTGLLVVGLTIGPRSWLIALLFLGVWIAGRRTLLESGSLIRSALRFAWAAADDKLVRGVGALGFISVGLCATALALMPPSDWDSLMYHLRVPSQWLHAGRVFLPPDNLHVAFVGLGQMLYLPLLALDIANGPAVLNVVLGCLLACTCLALCIRFFTPSVGWMALALLWGTPTILLVMVTPRIDVTLSLFALLAHYCLLCALADPHRSYAFLASLFLGMASGTKYQGLLYLVGLSPLLIVAAMKQGTTTTSVWKALTSYVLGFAVVAVPWFFKNLLLLGAPLYPFLTAAQVEPWLVPLFGQHVVPKSVDPAVFTIMAEVRSPFSLWQSFVAPHRLTVEGEGAFQFTNPLLMLLPLAVFAARRDTVIWLALPALLYLSTLLLPFPATNLRYLLPAIPALTVACCVGLDGLAHRLAKVGRRAVIAATFAIGLAPTVIALIGTLGQAQVVRFLVGRLTLSDYLASHADPGVAGLARVMDVINGMLPKDARVLMLYEARGYYLKPDVIEDPRVTNWPLLTNTGRLETCLQVTGVTHVLIGTGAMHYYVERGLNPERLRKPVLDAFIGRCLTPLAHLPGFELYEVR